MKRDQIRCHKREMQSDGGAKTGLKKQCFPPILLGFFIFAITSFNGCSSGLKVESERRQGDIIIDGSDSEWRTGLYYDKESDVVYGIRNDDDYVYVFLKTQNRSIQWQILGSGFVVWFDAKGGKNSSFGIRYPLDRQNVHPDNPRNPEEEQSHILFDQSFPELEILGPNKEDIQRFPILEAPGIHIKMSRSRDALIYELQLPLKKTSSHPFAIGADSKNVIGIGFETGKFKHEEKKGGAHHSGDLGEGGKEDAPMGGGEYQGRGSGRGHRGGASEGNEKSKELDLWLSVQLVP